MKKKKEEKQPKVGLVLLFVARVKSELERLKHSGKGQSNLVELEKRFSGLPFLTQREEERNMKILRIKAEAFDKIMELVG